MRKPELEDRLALRNKPLNQSVVMEQKWRDLLFIHWEIEPSDIQRTLPQGLYVDTFEEKAYVGITPFFMKDVHPAILPVFSPVSDFREVNVRTYVYNEAGLPGIWFYSLDADQWLAVNIAKLLSLPYYHASIDAFKETDTEEITYRIQRKNSPVYKQSVFRYKKRGDQFFADPGTLWFFFIERYLLYSFDRIGKKIITGRVHHSPYPLFDVDVLKYDTNLLELDGLSKPTYPPVHMIYSSGVDVDIYMFKGLL